jgi:hypothetical protein
MGRTIALVGIAMFTVGVIALSSFARRTQNEPSPYLTARSPLKPESSPRRILPAYAFDLPFSMN